MKKHIYSIRQGHILKYKKCDDEFIPENWKCDKLQYYIQLISGQHIAQDEYNLDEKGIPYLTGPADFDEKCIRATKFTERPKALCKKDDVLITVKGSGVGKAIISDNDYCISRQLMAIRCTNISNKLIYFHMKMNEEKYNSESLGLIPGITRTDILNKKIMFPVNISEQQKIADILSTWDKAIEFKEKLIEEKKKQKKGLMQKLLTGEVRVSGFDKEWHEVSLKHVFSRVTRKNEVFNTNVLTISAQRGLINQEDFFNKSVASSVLDNYYLLKKNEFAYNKSYSKGYPMGAIKRLKDYKSGVVTTLYICFAIRDTKECDIDYFEHFFESGILNKGLTQIAQEGGRAHGLLNVSTKDFFELKITLPGIKEQEAITVLLNGISRNIELLQQELQALKQQKKGLMQLLLTGIVRVGTEDSEQ